MRFGYLFSISLGISYPFFTMELRKTMILCFQMDSHKISVYFTPVTVVSLVVSIFFKKWTDERTKKLTRVMRKSPSPPSKYVIYLLILLCFYFLLFCSSSVFLFCCRFFLIQILSFSFDSFTFVVYFTLICTQTHWLIYCSVYMTFNFQQRSSSLLFAYL